MNISPYLYAVQSLKGKTPSEKKKELHSISNKIIENNDELLEFIETNETTRVQPALIPHLRVLVGKKSTFNNVIIEALKSNDSRIFNQALKATWFFSSSNSLICADYFRINILPIIDQRKRWKLIRKLSRCLKNDSAKSKEFFVMLNREYDIKLALPFLVGFDEKLVYETILRNKLILTGKVLSDLFKKYPKVAVKYLQLGNRKKVGNRKDRNIHEIPLVRYEYFLPKLVRHHTSEFIQLYDCLESPEIRLGTRVARCFIKNATIILITHPKKFLNLLPLKIVTHTLSPQHFKTMFENLFPKNVKDFDITKMASYLHYYPQDKKMDLLEAKYHLLYNDGVFRNKRIIESPAFYDLFSKQLKDKCRRQRIKIYGDPKNTENVLPCKLPPKICIPRLKKELSETLSPEEVMEKLEFMIISCSIYESREDLLEVLEYYCTNQKHQSSEVLLDFFYNLADQFDLTVLSKAHWDLIKELILWGHDKGYFQDGHGEEAEVLFKAALYQYLKLCYKEEDAEEADKIFLNDLIRISIECFFGFKISFIYSETPELCKFCMDLFMSAIPKLYPPQHKIWNSRGNKLNLTLYLIYSMIRYNKVHYPICAKSPEQDITVSMFSITDYPWLAGFVQDLMKIYYLNGFAEALLLCSFREALKICNPDFYESIIDDDPTLIYDVTYSMSILKRNPSKILSKWELYFNACKRNLMADYTGTKLFVAESKWHQEIPMKFVQQCLTNLQDEGSIKMLQILLEKDELDRVYKEML